MTLAPCYAIENVTLKDASVILYSSLPLATMYISSVFILCLFWKDYFVFTMENPNVFTREVSVFRFFLCGSFIPLFDNFISEKTFRIESEWLAGSIKSDFQIHHNSFYYLFPFLNVCEKSSHL